MSRLGNIGDYEMFLQFSLPKLGSILGKLKIAKKNLKVNFVFEN